MGVNGVHNTVEGNVSAYNTVCVRAIVEYCSCRRTGYDLDMHFLTNRVEGLRIYILIKKA